MNVQGPSSDAGELRTRRSLINRMRNLEDQDSWQEFFDTYWRLIYSVARRAGCTEQEAEDVVQETAVTVTKCIQEYRYDPKVCSFKSWLRQKTQWRIIDQVRKRPAHFIQETVTPTAASGTSLLERIPDPESLKLDSLWEEEWRKNLVETAMERIKRRIKPEHYQIFYLSAVRNLGPRRIAETLGVSVAQVYLVRHRVAALVKKEVQILDRQRH